MTRRESKDIGVVKAKLERIISLTGWSTESKAKYFMNLSLYNLPPN